LSEVRTSVPHPCQAAGTGRTLVPPLPPKAGSKRLVPSSRTLKKLHAAIVSGPTKLTSIGNFGLRYSLGPAGDRPGASDFGTPGRFGPWVPPPAPCSHTHRTLVPLARQSRLRRLGHRRSPSIIPADGRHRTLVPPPEFQTLRTYRVRRPPASASAHDATRTLVPRPIGRGDRGRGTICRHWRQ
jgi:hypothetical protein